MLVSVDILMGFMADENAGTLGQHPRIDGKGKIAKVPIFAVKILSVGPGLLYAHENSLFGVKKRRPPLVRH